MYGTKELASAYADCAYCPSGTYNDLEGSQYCRVCGSSSTAAIGSAMCSCIGKYRYYQPSDGSCECLSGYLYYDEASGKSVNGDSDADCQQVVDSTCSTTEIRWASDRSCRNPSSIDCTESCTDGGSVHVSLG